MALILEKIWAHVVKPQGGNPPSGGIQDNTSKWACEFVEKYKEVQKDNCSNVVFATHFDEDTGDTSPNEVEQAMHQICFASDSTQNAQVLWLTERLAGAIDYRTGITLNIVTVFSENPNANEKHLGIWTYPSDDAFDMQPNGTIKVVERIFLQKKLLRKAGLFTFYEDYASTVGTSRGKLFDKLAKYDLNKSSGYWRSYLDCVPSLTDSEGTERFGLALRDVLNDNQEPLEIAASIQKVDELLRSHEAVSLNSIIQKFPVAVQEGLRFKLKNHPEKDTPFKIVEQKISNYFSYFVRELENGVSVITPNKENLDGLRIEKSEDGEKLSIDMMMVVSMKARTKNV